MVHAQQCTFEERLLRGAVTLVVDRSAYASLITQEAPLQPKFEATAPAQVYLSMVLRYEGIC